MLPLDICEARPLVHTYSSYVLILWSYEPYTTAWIRKSPADVIEASWYLGWRWSIQGAKGGSTDFISYPSPTSNTCVYVPTQTVTYLCVRSPRSTMLLCQFFTICIWVIAITNKILQAQNLKVSLCTFNPTRRTKWLGLPLHTDCWDPASIPQYV